MLVKRQRSSWQFIIVVTLLATVLGGAYVGYRSGSAPRESDRLAAAQKAADEAAAKKKAAAARKNALNKGDKTTDENAKGKTKEDEEGDGWSFHDRLKKFFAEGDETLLDGLRPRGITEIEGMGGKGLGRQVKSHGVWYPVFDLSKAKKDGSTDGTDDSGLDPEKVELNAVPLSIASPNPPAGMVGQAFSYVFAAVGGSPPYRWSMQLSAAADRFSLDPISGLLRGQSEEPVSAPMSVFVSDSDGAQASAAFSLVISPANPLVITTNSLPLIELNKPYQATLTGEGGVPPYTWSIVTTAPLTCDPATGVISGTATQAGEFTIAVTLMDSQQTAVDKTLGISATAGLEIKTESPLLPATPGARYSTTFEAEGGTPPYTWQISGGSLPDGWSLDPTSGLLSGLAGKQEGLFHFGVRVSDANGLDYDKTFDLAVMQPLIVVPSRQRAGIAWQLKNMARVLSVPVASVSVNRTGPGGVREVYRGTGSNFVDHNLATGASYDYQLTVNTVNGKSVNFGSQRVTILPFTLSRGSPGVTADPYVDRVVAFNPLTPNGYGSANLPFNVTGPPDGHSTFQPAAAPNEVASLHAFKGQGGSITLEFTDNIIELGPGLDFTVFENVFFVNNDPNQRFMEPGIVEVAQFQGEWMRFPTNVNPPVKGAPVLTNPNYYAQGFAGVNATTGDTPTDPSRSGGDSFDINQIATNDLTWVRYIRVQSTGDKMLSDSNGNVILHTAEQGALTGKGSSGFDLDAVSAINY